MHSTHHLDRRESKQTFSSHSSRSLHMAVRLCADTLQRAEDADELAVKNRTIAPVRRCVRRGDGSGRAHVHSLDPAKRRHLRGSVRRISPARPLLHTDATDDGRIRGARASEKWGAAGGGLVVVVVVGEKERMNKNE